MTTNVAQADKAKPNRMERRRLETRNKLLAATLKLVIKHGIDKTTLDDITEAADLGRRTFYYHFSGKEECIQAAAASAYIQHAKKIDVAEQSDDPVFIVAASVQVVLEALIDEPITQALLEHPRLLGSAVVEALGDFARRDIFQGIDSGHFVPSMSTNKLDRIIMWTIVGVLVESVDADGQRSIAPQEYAQTLLMILGVPFDDAKTAAENAHSALNM